VTDEEILSRYPEVNIYNGKSLKGRVKATYLGGTKIFSKDDKNLVEKLNLGKVLKRSDY
jgi:dihydroorotase-like cyclic amidohydrolase